MASIPVPRQAGGLEELETSSVPGNDGSKTVIDPSLVQPQVSESSSVSITSQPKESDNLPVRNNADGLDRAHEAVTAVPSTTTAAVVPNPAGSTSTFSVTSATKIAKKRGRPRKDATNISAEAVDAQSGSSGMNNSKRKVVGDAMGEEEMSGSEDRSSSNNTQPKRKRKVTKACIFCKRSHMTCTENRPCDRCIKRGISHLCTDAPGEKALPRSAKSGTEEPSTSTSTSTSTAKPRAPKSAKQSPATEPQSLSPAGRAHSTTPRIGGTTELPAVSRVTSSHPLQPYDQQQQQTFNQIQALSNALFPGSQPSPGTASTHTPSPAFSSHVELPPPGLVSTVPGMLRGDVGTSSLHSGQQIQQQQQVHQSTQPAPYQQQQLAHPSQQQQNHENHQNQQNHPFNPFAVLNQAYDYSYPSVSGSSNTLASLRLFATTADPDFGGFGDSLQFAPTTNGTSGGGGQTSTSGFGFGGRDWVDGQLGSENGTGSDIDSTALDDFLKTLDEMYLNPMPDVPQAPSPSLFNNLYQHSGETSAIRTIPDVHRLSRSEISALFANSRPTSRAPSPTHTSQSYTGAVGQYPHRQGVGHASAPGGAPRSRKEKFLLTAAHQKEGTRDERLNKVIRAKYEAGLLKPFNHIKGYERLNTWMERKWTTSSKHRTLKIISEFRPAFRVIAQGLTDLDLIFIEEAFERLLLDCDRLFSTMGIPAVLWRRTGEIFKGNREFADLVGISHEHFRDGKLAIYELMAEDPAVNFWEKYGSIAFDPGQKAVLTSCILINQAKLRELYEDRKVEGGGSSIRRLESNVSTLSSTGLKEALLTASSSIALADIPQEALVYCTFSFTIRRDAYHIPNAIVGNFMPYLPDA